MGAQQGKESNSTSGSLPRHHQHHGMVLQHPADALGGGGGAEPVPTAAAPKSRIKGLRARSSSHHTAAAATATPPPAMPRSVSPLVAAGSSGDGVVQTGKACGCFPKVNYIPWYEG